MKVSQTYYFDFENKLTAYQYSFSRGFQREEARERFRTTGKHSNTPTFKHFLKLENVQTTWLSMPDPQFYLLMWKLETAK